MKSEIMKRRTNKKSQVWLSDYTLSMQLFILAPLLSVKIIINSFSNTSNFEELKSDASKMSEILLSEGYPVDWNSTNVIRPGLLTAKRLDEEKVARAMNTTYINYTSLRSKLQTRYDFLVIFEHPAGDMLEFDNNEFCTIGSQSVTINDDPLPGGGYDCHNVSFSFNYKEMMKLNRFVVYDAESTSEIIRMVVYVWY